MRPDGGSADAACGGRPAFAPPARRYHDDVRFAPRNFVRAALLLLLKERTDHGYGLTTRLDAMGVTDGNAGAIYRALRALERMGLVASTWAASSSGPLKRVYVLTPAGVEALDAWTQSLRREHEVLTEYLERSARQGGSHAAAG